MSTTTTTTTKTIAFLGATGGCTLPVLARALSAGHHATALARNPAKLRTALISTAGVAADVVDRNLTIVAGSASDAGAMRSLLTVPGSSTEKTLVDLVISGIGGAPKLQWSLRTPATIDNPHICESAARGVEEALRGLLAEGYRVRSSSSSSAGAEEQEKPVMITISTTGISRLQRDVPLLFLPLYHWLGKIPHDDKRAMEDRVVAATHEGTLRDFVIVRPSLLVDGEAKGRQALRVGWEPATEKSERAPGPAVGYTTTRDDVAAWIWEEAVLNTEKWRGKCVSLTY